MIYGYARCSTNEDRQDINRQIRELKEAGATRENIYLEYESGTKVDRIELNRLLDKINEGDTIVATEVSRITRSTKQLCEIIELAKAKKIKLILGNFVVDCIGELDPMTEGMLKMMGVFAEMERNITSQRVKSGLENAKAKGKKLGRPKVTPESLPKNFIKYYNQWKNKELKKVEFVRLFDVSRPTLDLYIETYEKGIEIISIKHVKKNISMGDDKYNEYALKVRHLKNGHIEATYKLINVKEDNGQIKEGHIYTMDMYKK